LLAFGCGNLFVAFSLFSGAPAGDKVAGGRIFLFSAEHLKIK
jgi:hypothetical protein